MRAFILAAAVALFATAAAFGDITFEGEAKIEAYSIAKVRAKSPEYRSFIYKVFDQNGKRVKTERGEGGWLLFTGAPGKYRVEAVAGKTDKDGNLLLDEADFTVTIGDAPEPPGPPDPPKPPADQLLSAVRSALAADLDPKKKDHCAALAEVYAVAASAVMKDEAKTVGQLQKQLLAGNEAAGLVGKLGTVKSVLDTHCRNIPTKSSTVIDSTNKGAISFTLSEASRVLKEVAK